MAGDHLGGHRFGGLAKLIGVAEHPDLATCEIDTFRYRVLHVAARITRGARHIRTRIDATWR